MSDIRRKLAAEQTLLRLVLNDSSSTVNFDSNLQNIAFSPFGGISIFASSSIVTGQNLDDLLAKDRWELSQVNLKKYVLTIGESLGIHPIVKMCIGSWEDGVEERIVITLPTTTLTELVNLFASMIGKKFHQKCVMLYNDNEEGIALSTGSNSIIRIHYRIWIKH